MDTNKRFILATVLFLVFLIIWQMVYIKPQQEKLKQAQRTVEAESTTISATSAESGSVLVDTTRPAGIAQLTTPESSAVSADTVVMVVENKLFSAKIDGHGTIRSFYIKKYHAELVPEGGYILSTPFDENILPAFDVKDTFRLEDSSLTLVFSTKIQDSVMAAKVYTFYPDSYLVKISVPDTVMFTGIKPNEENEKDELRYTGLIVYKNKLRKYAPKKFKKGLSIDLEDAEWVGYRTKYFMVTFVPQVKLDDIQGISDGKFNSKFTLISHGRLTGTAYLGPIDYYLLKDIGYGLWKAYDFGPSLIRPFAKVLLAILRFIYNNVVHNYGWAIVIFAVFMKLLFWPLNIKNLRNMHRMQELKPKLNALQKAYKDDPQKLQQETMELYKKYGVNPFSGCVVVLLQLPIFWAMFQVLKTYIELRGAPWILWIRDLSSKDPYYVLPILMGAASLVQALMQPAQDEQSRMTAIIMPIVFTFIFITFPSGVVLYWLTFNLLGILELLWIKKMHH